jgi:hypothetical protein
MEWQILYFSEDLQREIMEFPAGIQARFIHLAERIMTFGPNLGMPHSRAMGGGLFELRRRPWLACKQAAVASGIRHRLRPLKNMPRPWAAVSRFGFAPVLIDLCESPDRGRRRELDRVV